MPPRFLNFRFANTSCFWPSRIDAWAPGWPASRIISLCRLDFVTIVTAPCQHLFVSSVVVVLRVFVVNKLNR